MVPASFKLSEEEADELLKRYNISPLQLPTILSKDPMVKALRAKIGDIIKIEHKGPTGKSFFYRRVIK